MKRKEYVSAIALTGRSTAVVIGLRGTRWYNRGYMGSDSIFSRLRKILEKPAVPAHVQAASYDVVVPWYTRLWHLLRPPSAVPTERAPMNSSQRRMLKITAAIVLPLLAIGGTINYVSKAPERAQAAFEEGMRRMGPSNFAGAVEKFTESISASETAAAHLERGNAYQNLGKADLALADWTRAIDLDSSMAAAFTARATYYRIKGDAEKALPDLNQSIQLDPSVDGYFQRGQVYAALGQWNKAVEDYDRAILERREAPYVYLARSIARRALGDEAGYSEDQQTAARLQSAN